VKGRLAVVEFATLHGVSPAAPRFGLDRKTVRAWRDRAREAGAAGLVPRYPARRRRIPIGVVELIAHARQEFRWGACRIRMWLMRVHQVQLATKTISKICDDLGLPRPQRAKRRRAGQQLKLFEKATPGESVQVDVKVVKVDGRKAYQYTAIDDCTRLRVLRLYRRRNVRVSQEFLGQMIQAFPFPIRKVQTDRGQEFSFAFLLAVERHGIRHRYIQPRRPDENGKGERSHRIDAEEFWSRYTFETFEAARAALHGWERTCVHEARFSMALHGRAPAEKLAAVLAAALTPDAPFSRVRGLTARPGLEPCPKAQRYEWARPASWSTWTRRSSAALPRSTIPSRGSPGHHARQRWEYAQVCVDDASGAAHVEILPDERKGHTTGFPRRAAA